MQKFLLAISSILIAFGLLTAGIVSATTSQPLPNKSTATKWEPVNDVVSGYRMYIDRNALERTLTKDTDIATGILLLVPETGAIQVKNNGKEIAALSIARYMVVDCQGGVVVPVFDLYFDTKTPSAETTPIGGVSYEKSLPINILPKTSKLFTVLCPISI